MRAPIRAGIAGANPARGCVLDVHLPALRRLPEFKLAAVSARNPEVADQARAVFGAQRAFGDSLHLGRDPDIDLIAVTVKVPEHNSYAM